jgi:hypothetical protein
VRWKSCHVEIADFGLKRKKAFILQKLLSAGIDYGL